MWTSLIQLDLRCQIDGSSLKSTRSYYIFGFHLHAWNFETFVVHILCFWSSAVVLYTFCSTDAGLVNDFCSPDASHFTPDHKNKRSLINPGYQIWSFRAISCPIASGEKQTFWKICGTKRTGLVNIRCEMKSTWCTKSDPGIKRVHANENAKCNKVQRSFVC